MAAAFVTIGTGPGEVTAGEVATADEVVTAGEDTADEDTACADTGTSEDTAGAAWTDITEARIPTTREDLNNMANEWMWLGVER